MTSKQFYIMLFVFTVSLKVQKLPCIIYGEVKRDGWITMLAYMVINIVGILLAFYILHKTKHMSLEDRCKSRFAEVIKRVLMLLVAFYFLMQALILFESMQNLFEHTLFENLSWRIFSLLLLACVVYLSITGLRNIARNFELYFTIIIFSYILLLVMGSTTTDFSEVLPFEDIDFHGIVESFSKFNLWFGDFFFILFIGKGSKEIKLGRTLLTYVASMLFVVFINVVFVGIYLEYCPVQSSLISMIAEQSMLGLNIGRVDWCFILLAEIGTILSCAVCFFAASKCLHCVVPKIKFGYLCVALSLILYIFDSFYLVDTHTRQMAIFGTLCVIALAVKVLVTAVLLVYSLFINSKEVKKQGKDMVDETFPETQEDKDSAQADVRKLRRKQYEKN